MTNQSIQDSYSEIIDLIFKDAQASLKGIDDSINILNTQLSAVAGFSAAIIKFIGDLPDQSTLVTGSLVCYSCLILKVLSLLLLATSTLVSFIGLLWKRGGEDEIISPKEQLEKCIMLSESEYKLLFIERYERNIETLIRLRLWKSKRLIFSGVTFVAAALLSALDLLLATILKPWLV